MVAETRGKTGEKLHTVTPTLRPALGATLLDPPNRGGSQDELTR
jgi:hypothetical protein